MVQVFCFSFLPLKCKGIHSLRAGADGLLLTALTITVSLLSSDSMAAGEGAALLKPVVCYCLITADV